MAINSYKAKLKSRVHLKILLWILTSTFLTLIICWNHVIALSQWISQLTPGGSQTYPIAGAIFVGTFILFKRQGIKASFEEEKANLMLETRLAGLIIAISPAIATYVLNLPMEADISATALALAWLGASAMVSPQTIKVLLPYTSLYIAATISPRILYPLAGELLADFASSIAGFMMRTMGISAIQCGRSFEITSINGEVIQFTISPNCSSISSITVFLLLCGLMHLDLKKRMSTTLLISLTGTLALIMLNALRIIMLLYIGYVGGDWIMWSIHRWIGYIIIIGFYTLAAKIYVSTGRSTYKINAKT